MALQFGLLFCLFFYASFSAYISNGEETRNWALLVAGSNTYMNYRHQADICHAYHIVKSHGIPDERIVVMMYDDIAYNRENPVQGNIINRPGGENVYPGVLKDYTGEEVTPEVFLKVLTGDSEGIENLLGRPGKVIKSGPKDHIFVNFADHGAPGLIAFPNDLLHAKDLNKAIMSMYEQNRYEKMVLYVEACESGSMFDNILRKDINVFATTAANPDQSSYACYFDQERQTYLGDVYSVNWMEDSDLENLASETLQNQFNIVKNETNTSHVMEYGDLSFRNNKVGDFQGNDDSGVVLKFDSERYINPNIDAVPSQDVPLEILKHKIETAKGLEKIRHMGALKELLKRNNDTVAFFRNVAYSVSNTNYDFIHRKSVKFTDFECYTESVTLIQKMCPGMKITQNDYALRNLRSLANLCEMNINKFDIWAAIKIVSGKSSLCN